MITYTITLTEAEDKALRFVANDVQDWIDNAVHERCRIAIDEVVRIEMQRMLADPSVQQIPADKETIVANFVPLQQQEIQLP